MYTKRVAAATMLALLSIVPLPADGEAMVRETIAIDGSFQDWQGVLSSNANSISDRAIYDSDPDAPAGANQDLRRFAVTWDADNLYLHWQRASESPGNKKDLVFVAYVDRDLDRRMGAGDLIVALRFERDELDENGIYSYTPVASSDPMPGDGGDVAGSGGSKLPSSMRARSDHPEHLRIEVSIPWVEVGVAPGSPLVIQPAIALLQGLDRDLAALMPHLRSGVSDNGGLLDTSFADLDLTAGRTLGGPPGATIDLAHRVTGLGNRTGAAELTVAVDEPMRVEIWSDPDGDGNPADGLRLAVDDNGDGDYVDVGDLLEPGADTTLDLRPDTGPLAMDAVFPLVARIFLPPGDANNGERTVLVTATSSADSSLTRLATNIVRVYRVTVSPSHDLLTRAGIDVPMAHQICNYDVGTQDIHLSAFADVSWPMDIRSAGVPVSRLSVASGACADITVTASVPPGATLGTLATISVLAWRTVPLILTSTTNTITVTTPLTLAPNGVDDGLAGSSVFHPHTLRNATGVSRAFDLRYSDSKGGSGRFWTDPDGDGSPDDGKLIEVTPPLDGFGGTFGFLAQVELAANLKPAEVVTSTIVAADPGAGTTSATATDVTTVRLVATYASPPPAVRAGLFPGCGTVYAFAGPLSGPSHRFKWYNPVAALIRVSAALDHDDDGFVEDRLDLLLSDIGGTWQVQLQEKFGGTWIDVNDGTEPFEVVRDLTGLGGAVTVLLTNTSSYAPTGAVMSLSSVLQNQASVPYLTSGVEYVVFRDADGDGHPDIGETYMQLDGSPAPWGTNARTCRATGLPPIEPGDSFFESSCTDLGPMSFGDLGGWRVYARWFSACDDTIAERQRSFNVGCVASAPGAAGADRLVCLGGATQLGTGPAEPGVSYLWSPAAFVDDPTLAQPLASPLSTITFSMQKVDSTGCIASDDVLVLVGTPPESDAGPSATICLGDSVRLGTTAVPGLTYSWSPTAGLDNPTSPRPWASPATTTSYTLTVSTSGIACGQTSVAVVTVKAAPSPSAGPDVPNPSVIGPATCDSGVSYGWTPSAGLDDPTACNPLASPATSTTYCLTAWDQATGCPSLSDCVLVGPGPCPPAPDAGADQVSPASLGPAICDPLVAYEWTPAEFLDDPAACNPVASPPSATEYCVRARNLSTGCLGAPDCVIVGEDCAVSPTAVDRLYAKRSGDDVQLSWAIEASSDGGYHVYRVIAKGELPTAPLIGLLAIATTPDRSVVTGIDLGAASAADDDSYLYQVVGVCADGTEGP